MCIYWKNLYKCSHTEDLPPQKCGHNIFSLHHLLTSETKYRLQATKCVKCSPTQVVAVPVSAYATYPAYTVPVAQAVAIQPTVFVPAPATHQPLPVPEGTPVSTRTEYVNGVARQVTVYGRPTGYNSFHGSDAGPPPPGFGSTQPQRVVAHAPLQTGFNTFHGRDAGPPPPGTAPGTVPMVYYLTPFSFAAGVEASWNANTIPPIQGGQTVRFGAEPLMVQTQAGVQVVGGGVQAGSHSVGQQNGQRDVSQGQTQAQTQAQGQGQPHVDGEGQPGPQAQQAGQPQFQPQTQQAGQPQPRPQAQGNANVANGNANTGPIVDQVD